MVSIALLLSIVCFLLFRLSLCFPLLCLHLCFRYFDFVLLLTFSRFGFVGGRV